jgi:DNA-binding response OmpR family regulator
MLPLLLVEDGISYFDTLRWTLRRGGYNVDCVSGGQEALDYLRLAEVLGLIVLHCKIPDPDLLARLKRTGAPVVVVTSAATSPVNGADLLKEIQTASHPEGG